MPTTVPTPSSPPSEATPTAAIPSPIPIRTRLSAAPILFFIPTNILCYYLSVSRRLPLTAQAIRYNRQPGGVTNRAGTAIVLVAERRRRHCRRVRRPERTHPARGRCRFRARAAECGSGHRLGTSRRLRQQRYGSNDVHSQSAHREFVPPDSGRPSGTLTTFDICIV